MKIIVASTWPYSHLEHDQVVVMPLYLEDVDQSRHSGFEIWRITCETQTTVSLFTWSEVMTRSKRKGESARTEAGTCFFLLSRLMRGSVALVLSEAASGSHFLYFSTAKKHAL